jgi:hypothetical protein
MRGTVVVCHAMLPPVRASIDLKRGTTQVPRDAATMRAAIDLRRGITRHAEATELSVTSFAERSRPSQVGVSRCVALRATLQLPPRMQLLYMRGVTRRA